MSPTMTVAVVVHMSINRDVIARALKLGASQHIVLAQSVGLPASR